MNFNPFDILKSALKVQDQMRALQDKLAGIVLTGSAGGGMVEIDLNARMEVQAVRISKEATEDLAMLQDLVQSALTAALEKARERSGKEMGALAASLPPGDFPGSSPAGQ